MYQLHCGPEIEMFNVRNAPIMEITEKLIAAVSEITKQISPKNNEEFVIALLGRICIRHYEALILLCTNGFGFRAMATARSLYEKSVDSIYLNRNRRLIVDFVDYGLVLRCKTGYESWARTIEPEFDNKTARFRKKKSWQQSWTTTSLVDRAKKVGDHYLSGEIYRHLHEFVHTSITEVEESMLRNDDGSLDFADPTNDRERIYADLAFQLGSTILIETLKNQMECFELPVCAVFEEYQSEFDEYYKKRKLVK